MVNENQNFQDKYPNLTDFERNLLAKFSEVDSDLIYSIIMESDRDDLSEESLQLVLQEHRLFSGVGTNLLNVARENYDLKTKYKDLRSQNKILGTSIVIGLLIIGLLLYLFSVYPKYKVVQTTNNGPICELSPENNPMLTDVSIQDFSRLAVLSIYNISYVDWRNQIESATTRYFTTEGRASINKALRENGVVDYIIQNNLIMKSVIISTPQIDEKGEEGGKPYWIVQVPIVIEFYSGKPKPIDTQKFVAQVKITTSIRDAFNPKGIGVSNLVLKPYKGIK